MYCGRKTCDWCGRVKHRQPNTAAVIDKADGAPLVCASVRTATVPTTLATAASPRTSATAGR